MRPLKWRVNASPPQHDGPSAGPACQAPNVSGPWFSIPPAARLAGDRDRPFRMEAIAGTGACDSVKAPVAVSIVPATRYQRSASSGTPVASDADPDAQHQPARLVEFHPIAGLGRLAPGPHDRLAAAPRRGRPDIRDQRHARPSRTARDDPAQPRASRSGSTAFGRDRSRCMAHPPVPARTASPAAPRPAASAGPHAPRSPRRPAR